MTKIVIAEIVHSTVLLKSAIASCTGPVPGCNPMPQGTGAPKFAVVSPTKPPVLRSSCDCNCASAAPKGSDIARKPAIASPETLPNHRPITLCTPCLPALCAPPDLGSPAVQSADAAGP